MVTQSGESNMAHDELIHLIHSVLSLRSERLVSICRGK